jgi:hypothetical protein
MIHLNDDQKARLSALVETPDFKELCQIIRDAYRPRLNPASSMEHNATRHAFLSGIEAALALAESISRPPEIEKPTLVPWGHVNRNPSNQ